MGANKFMVPGLLVVLIVVVAACQPLPAAGTRPTVAPSVATSVPGVPAAPTNTAAPAEEEEDCMAACHIPDANESFAAGAKPQPASHAGRPTCLACHATLVKPALPATHVGRLDVSCAVCHTTDAGVK